MSALAFAYDEAGIVALGDCYEPLLELLGATDLGALRQRCTRELARLGVTFRGRPFAIDPVPRLLGHAEWELLRAGLEQRVRALGAFVADVYGARRIVEAGTIEARVVDGSADYEPALRGRWPAAAVAIPIAGLDIVRDPAGGFQVLEDNVRTPSAFAYGVAARRVTELLHWSGPDRWDAVDVLVTGLRRTVRAAAPAGVEDPRVVVLSDGPHSPIWFEHVAVARWLEAPLVGLGDLERRGPRLFMRDGGARVPVDVVYRRLDEERLRDEDGRATEVGELLLEPWLAGRLGLVNPFGTGVADDKLMHAHVETMIRFYLGESPLLRSTRTFDLSCPVHRERVLGALRDHVVKPRIGQAGRDVTIGADADDGELRRVAARVRAAPDQWIAQPTVVPSHHPTLVGARLEPRHVDLRPFVLSTPERVEAVPGAVTRYATGAGGLLMNFSRGGSVKDTWTLRSPTT